MKRRELLVARELELYWQGRSSIYGRPPKVRGNSRQQQRRQH